MEAGGKIQTETAYDAYAESILERALETGRNVRWSVVVLFPNSSDGKRTGWYFSGDIVVTAGHILVIEQGVTARQVDDTSVNTTTVDNVYFFGQTWRHCEPTRPVHRFRRAVQTTRALSAAH